MKYLKIADTLDEIAPVVLGPFESVVITDSKISVQDSLSTEPRIVAYSNGIAWWLDGEFEGECVENQQLCPSLMCRYWDEMAVHLTAA